MSDSKAVKERIERLIAEVPELTRGDGYQQRAWLTAALNAVDLACPSANNAYFVAARRIVTSPTMAPPHSLFEMAAMMARLLEEIDRGLLTTIENHAVAVTFHDFLDHGAEYLRYGRKDEAAVVAGIVFEDTIRRICRVLGATENGVALDTLISELSEARSPGSDPTEGQARWSRCRVTDLGRSRPVGGD